MKSFKGNVKPFVEINGFKRVEFGEIIPVEDWQVDSKHFQFALKNRWVISADRTAVVLNRTTPEPKQSVRSKPIVVAQKEAVRELQQNESVSPAFLTDVLDKQTILIQSMQKSYETIQKNTTPQPQGEQTSNADVLKLLAALLEQQKILVDQSKQQSPVDNSQLISTLLSEIRTLSQPASTDSSAQVVALLAEIKEQLANQKTQVVYNNSKGSAGAADPGFKIHEVEENYVAKVEELKVKDSKIVTQQTTTGGTDDALAALRKLKGK